VASVLSQYQFERTVRYLLVTGEEQGLLGSAAYAAEAYAAGDNIVAVLSLDMIAWDAIGGPVVRLYTRLSGDPGYAGDLAIATTFTNVVSTYGLPLSPLITSDGMGYSDHASFWNTGFPAILGIEHFGVDFNLYYHTANDTLANLNVPYFTAFAKAAAGTVAHLARPVEARSLDVLRVVSGDSAATNTDFGATIFHARHQTGAQETNDSLDAPATNTHSAWLKLATHPDLDDLATDSRPTDSESIFQGTLSVVTPDGTPVTCTNQLRFAFLTPPDPKRIYSVRVEAGGFLLATNLCDLVAGGGLVQLPTLSGVTNGAAYGSCDIAARFLDQDAGAIGAQVSSGEGTQVLLKTFVQAGTRVEDIVQVSTNLVAPNSWMPAVTYTNDVPVTAENFEAGWETLAVPVDITAVTNAPDMFFRIRRTWITP